MTPDLATLVERVEGASGADRELDARIHVALFPDERGMTHPGKPDASRGSTHGPLHELDWDAWESLSKARGSDLGMVANHHLWPAYTLYVDAALALVERVLPGWAWTVSGPDRLAGQTTAYACLADKEDNGAAEPWLVDRAVYDARAATPALALLSALLRALTPGAPT